MNTKELIFSLTKKDFTVQTFRSGGKGGQHQNKTSSGVRIIHNESGARGESREERSQVMNKRKALERLSKSPLLRLWIQTKLNEITTGETIAEIVERDMQPENLKIEFL